MLWLVGEQNDYFRAVADGFSGEESILLLSEAEAVLKLEPYFDDSANLDSLSVVTFESCSQFLERVVEVSSSSSDPGAGALLLTCVHFCFVALFFLFSSWTITG